MNFQYRKILTATFLIILKHFQLVSCTNSQCYPITHCTPNIAAFDSNSLNTSIKIECIFRNKIQDPLDIMWKYYGDLGERMVLDFDGKVLPPFTHEIIQINATFPDNPRSISLLTVRFANSSFFGNYSIFSVKGNCYVNVKLSLKETALGLVNKSSILFRDSWTILAGFFLIYFLIFVML